jgi:hypothetical protein
VKAPTVRTALLAALAQLSEEQACGLLDGLAQLREQLDDAIADDDDAPPPSVRGTRAAVELLCQAGDAARAALAEPEAPRLDEEPDSERTQRADHLLERSKDRRS